MEPAIDNSADKAFLEAKTAEWANAFNAGDAATLAAMYSEDAVIYPPGMPPVQGRAGVQEVFQGYIDTGASGDLHGQETFIEGDLAYKVGHYSLKNADGSPMDEGSYLEVWRKIDGQWWFVRDMWNSDLPAPE